MIGQRLSHYTLLEEIHRGESQIVYRARDEKLNREVALKVLPRERVREAARRQGFITEAKASASLEHPHIGVIHEIDEVDGTVFIAMELLEGQDLAARLEQGPLELSEALELASGIAAGLAYAHERGIVHRDVKPANVVLTDQGHPKLVDFGLAKLLATERSPFLGRAGEQEGARGSSTREGRIAGTVSYMSPEQARGGKVDERSDVFNFGVVLYHMLSGALPFEGLTHIDTLHAILREPTPRLSGPSAEARQILQPIVDKCLAKDPDDRYQRMAEVLEELRSARRTLETGIGLFAGRRALIVAGLMAVTAAVTVVLSLVVLDEPPPPVEPSKPSIAVLHFENLSGDPELDWLRTGLTEMLVTDLSQSRDLEVLGTDRLYQSLEDMGRLHEAPLASEAVEELARRTGVNTVLLGSFAKAGETVRLSARLEDARTGQVLHSTKAEGRGAESIFRLVDELTQDIMTRLGIAPPAGELDRDLRDVTTDSLEAYRHYAEGIRLHERLREEEAIPHFQRAIELDPGFAMALAKLGVVMSNLGLHDEADRYAERALEHVDRLSARERYYIEGWYYSRRPETLERAFEAYRRAIELYPDHGSARHNLGNLLYSTERFQQAIEQLEELRRRRMLFPGTYEQLSMAYKTVGDIAAAREVLTEYQNRHPDDSTTLVALAQIDIETGQIESGLEALEQAGALGAPAMHVAPVRWEAHILREEWNQAMGTAVTLLESEGPVEKFLGGRLYGITSLYRGELDAVLEAVDRYTASVEGNSRYRTQPLLFKARLLLEAGENEAARAVALETPTDERFGGSQALILASLASARMGDLTEADRLAASYRERINPALGPEPERLYHLLQGELALARNEYQQAISHLHEAESMLPPRGSEAGHTVIWYSLATAHRLAGNFSEAVHWYRRIVEASEERLYQPIRYVRSFYFLGELYDELGDAPQVRSSFEQFLEHWGEGELDRDRVMRARAETR